ncbi:cytidylyltransferase domain-containing protein [Coprobacter tertius]|uniref:Acylneuraminate cytidylyltransferase family protein n=1 Tax=Coprobacter tertius TaxID=2944915 RepID=A0ABT1MD90_9BACT|nr:acylneuraminate cytidylyltransferase family protein [Coprobacter tertius]MCP9610602.1 acylneuraminate cytidylyltransferase family protein [Coprobacter tertius]
MRALFLIPARGGSKGIPRKNIKKLGGRPLIYYTIDAARGIASDNDICVSTDDDEIIEVVREYGLSVPFKRPEELATDRAGSYEVIMHALKYYEDRGIYYDVVVLLQPTSPFRTARHIREAISLYDSSYDMVVSVIETDKNPYFVLFEEDKNGYLQRSKDGHFTRRQDCPKVYEYNGAIYVMNVDSLKSKSLGEFSKNVKYVMNNIDNVDLDTPLDWEFAEFLIAKRNGRRK